MAWYEELIADVAAAFRMRDFDRIQRHSQPEMTFDFSRSIGPGMGMYEGIEEVREYFDFFIDAWETIDMQLTDVEELAADRLLVTSRLSACGRGSGLEVEAGGAQLWELREGKVMRVTFFQSRDEAAAELEL